VKLSGGKAPAPVTPSPIKAASQSIHLMMTEIESSSRKDQSRLKKECCSRDDHKCVITGIIDIEKSQSMSPEERGKLSFCRTQCAHILPFALRKFNEKDAQEVNHFPIAYVFYLGMLTSIQTETKAIIWSALYRYFPFIRNKIKPETINQPENAITLEMSAHYEFGQYALVLEPTSEVSSLLSFSLSSSLFLIIL
jgi:hypothetical protein